MIFDWKRFWRAKLQFPRIYHESCQNQHFWKSQSWIIVGCFTNPLALLWKYILLATHIWKNPLEWLSIFQIHHDKHCREKNRVLCTPTMSLLGKMPSTPCIIALSQDFSEMKNFPSFKDISVRNLRKSFNKNQQKLQFTNLHYDASRGRKVSTNKNSDMGSVNTKIRVWVSQHQYSAPNNFDFMFDSERGEEELDVDNLSEG